MSESKGENQAATLAEASGKDTLKKTHAGGEWELSSLKITCHIYSFYPMEL